METINIQPMRDAPRDGSRIMLVFLSGAIASAKYEKGDPDAMNLLGRMDAWLIGVGNQRAIDDNRAIRGWYPFPEFKQIPNFGGNSIPKTESEEAA